MDPLDSAVHEIFQAGILEWVAMSYSRRSSWPRDETDVSCVSCFGRWILYHSTTGLLGISVRLITQCPTLQSNGLQQARLPCPSSAPRACSDLWPLSQWCHSINSSSVVLFSSCLQSFPSSGSFQMSQFFTSGGQGVGVSASTSILPMNTQDWFPLGLTGLISLQSKGLWRVFSNTTVQKHQFFNAQLSL